MGEQTRIIRKKVILSKRTYESVAGDFHDPILRTETTSDAEGDDVFEIEEVTLEGGSTEEYCVDDDPEKQARYRELTARE